jgi:archaeosine-15-forming tRNA-guanine transglycosylase
MATEAPMTSGSTRLPPWVFPAVLIAVAFFFRLWIGHLFSYFGGDTPGYTAIAQNLAAGHGYSLAHKSPFLATDIRLPGYPALLAIGFAISGSHWSVIVLNALLGSVSTLFVWLISRALHLTRTLSLWATGIAAVFVSTASFAGSAQSENLSVPAVLAFVYFVLIRPPKSRWALYLGGGALAWVAALTRDELVLFVVLVAVVAARRANLRALASVGLVICFLLGSGAWVLRNEVQVHRTEYVDQVMTDQVLVWSVNGNSRHSLFITGGRLLKQPTISPAQRSAYQHEVFTYVKKTLTHRFPFVVENKAKYYAEALFPVPIFGLNYNNGLKFVGRFLWTVLLGVAYIVAFMTARRWWKAGRRADVVSLWLFPVFILCFELIFDPQFRFILPATLLLLPTIVEGVVYAFERERATRRPKAAPSPSPS